MYIIDLVRRSSRTLKSAKLRTLLTALAIAVGAFTLSLTLSASNGLRDYTDRLIASNFDPAEILVGRDKEISNTGTPNTTPQEFDESVTTYQTGGMGAGLQLKRVTQADVEEIRAKPYVEQVRENFQINIRYVTREDQKKYTGSAQAYNPAQKPELLVGELPESGDIEQGTVLLPDSYISLLGFHSPEDALGKQIQLNVQKPFSAQSLESLIGSLQSGASLDQLSSQAEPEEKLVSLTVKGVTKKPSAASLSFEVPPVRISNSDARSLYDFTSKGTNDYEKYLWVNARIKDGKDEAKIEEAKQDLIAGGYYVIGTKEIQKTITQFVDVLTIMVGVFGLITIIASVFGIVNTQYISVLERTREIGLMKALGMSRKNVSRLFILEAIWVGFIGGLIGIIFGFLLGTAINPWLTDTLSLGEGNKLLIFNPLQTLVLLVSLMLVAAVAGLLPARKAAKLDPVEALRTE